MMKKTVVIRSDPDRRQWWKATFQNLLPEFEVVLLDEDDYSDDDVHYAVVWNPPLGMFGRFPNLECVVSIGAGISHILKDPNYPLNIPLIRTTGLPFQVRMAEYVVLHVLRFHRKLASIESSHSKRQWVQYLTPLASEVTVGFMGLGNLGSFAAQAISRLGFRTRGWSRRGKPVAGVEVFQGEEQLGEFLKDSNILVSILPQTPETENLLSSKIFQLLPDNSFFINAGRGENLVDEDLLTALNNGKLAGATLDVFRNEPLSATSPLWNHPKILITCHTAAAIDPRVGGQIIASNLRTFSRGEFVRDLVDISQGY